MPVYNGEQHIAAAVASILAQTWTDFELLIINDGSSDRSRDIICKLGDSRIVLLDNVENLGLINTLNRGVEMARGDYIARMDCDDISRPRRLEKQVAFLESHPDIGVCGAWISKFGSGKRKVCHYHGDPELLRAGLLFDSVLAHPAVMLRRKLFIDQRLSYDLGFKHAEDYDLWVRSSHCMKLGNLQEVLLDYRMHPAQVSAAHNLQQIESAGRVRHLLLAELGISPGTEEFETHQRISTYQILGDRELFARADQWLCRLKEANDGARVYPEPYFSVILTERLVTLLKKMLAERVMPKGQSLQPRLFRKTGLGWGFVMSFFIMSRRGEFTINHA